MTATWVATTKGGNASTATTAAVVCDSSTAVGDLLLAAVIIRGATTGQDVTAPAGWTHVVYSGTVKGHFPTGSGSGTNGYMNLYWMVATSAGAQTFNFTWPTGAVHSWLCDRITGQAGTPVEILGAATATTSTSLTTATITTTEASELVRRYVFGTVAAGGTAMTGSGMVWDAAVTKITDIQGAGTSGLVWGSTAREVGPSTAGSITGRSITLPNAPTASGTVAIGVLSGGGGGVVAPTNTTAPSITTDGSPETGETVTADTGTWANTPTSYAYQWKRNGSNISGATSSSYVLQVADEGQSITVTVTASNSAGSASATSGAITPSAAPILPAPVNTVAPSITTDGTPEVGETVSCSTGTWSNSPTSYAYQWRRNGIAISGATASTYTLTVSDVGTDRIACSVTATNSGGSATVNTASISPVLSGAATRAVVRYRYT